MKIPFNPLRHVRAELERAKSEGAHWWLLAMLIVLILLFMANPPLAWTVPDAKAEEALTFNLDVPEPNYNIPWLVKRLELPNHSKEQEMFMNYAYALANGDIRFPYKLKAENGEINQTTQSRCVDKNGKREPSFGFCQMHMQWYSSIINNPKFKTDWMWQMQECYKLWKGGTAMYGKVTDNVRKSFKIL